MRTHTMKDGTTIPINKMTNEHLLNTLRLLNHKSKTGLVVRDGGGDCAEDMWYDEYVIYGKEALQVLHYECYLKEARRRGLQPGDEAMSKRGIICCFCGKGFGYVGQEPSEDILMGAYEHEAQCDKNPYRLRIAELERQLLEAREKEQKLKLEIREAEEKRELCFACGKELTNAAPGGEVSDE